MKILITGAKGQLGRALSKRLKQKKAYELILTDLDEMDITDNKDVDRVILNAKPDVIINCAAHTKVDLCEDDKERALSINVRGAENLAKISNKIGAIMVHMSTDYVFDGNSTMPYIESDKPNPQSVYGHTKLKSEQLVIKNNSKHFILRSAWLYGQGNNFVRTMLRLANEHKQIMVVADQTATPTSADEVARAIEMLINTQAYGIYHATCEGECNWYQYACKIFELKGIDIEVKPCSTKEIHMKAKRPKYSVLENKELEERHSYTFKHWEQALKDYIKL